MPDEYDDESESLPEEDFEDSYVAQAKEELIGRIDGQREDVFYERQLQVSIENDYYHWVTARALEELTEDGEIRSERVPLRRTIMTEDGQVASGVQMRFFFSKKLLYWTRKAKKIAALVEAYSEPTLTKAVGNQAEILFDAALPRGGFMPVARNAREYNGKRWEQTNHNLDRIFVRDGAAYGIEIKNQLGYMENKEFMIKLEMCRFLRITPVFIARMMPKA